jgi:hypothetical protein
MWIGFGFLTTILRSAVHHLDRRQIEKYGGIPEFSSFREQYGVFGPRLRPLLEACKARVVAASLFQNNSDVGATTQSLLNELNVNVSVDVSSEINNLGAHVNGPFDYIRTPLAPPGIRVHEKPAESWSPHGVDGWYIGPALDAYSCVWDTRRERNTLQWLPTKVTIASSATHLVIAAAHDIVNALNNPSAARVLLPPVSWRERLEECLLQYF